MKETRISLDEKANEATRQINLHIAQRERDPDTFLGTRVVFTCPNIKGLELRVTNNSASWTVIYNIRRGDKWSKGRVALGSYAYLTVGAARKEGGEIRTRITKGGDPAAEKKAAADQRQSELDSALSVNALFEQWITSPKMRNRKTGTDEPARMMQKDVLPRIGKLDVVKVTSRHLAMLSDAIEPRGARITNTVMALVRQMLGFAAGKFLISDVPAFPPKLEENPPCDRSLSVSEVIELFNKFPDSRLVNTSQLALKLQLATACRIGELLQASWSHVNLNAREWLIPTEHSKTGAPLTVYLSDYATSLFSQLHELSGSTLWLFPNSKETGPLDLKTITKQVRDRQRDYQIAGRTTAFDALILSGGTWTPHDLRRTAAVLMQAIHINPFIIEKCLNHAAEKMARTYTPIDPELDMYNAWQELGEVLAVIDSDKAAELDQLVKANAQQPIRNRSTLPELIRKVKASNILTFAAKRAG